MSVASTNNKECFLDVFKLNEFSQKISCRIDLAWWHIAGGCAARAQIIGNELFKLGFPKSDIQLINIGSKLSLLNRDHLITGHTYHVAISVHGFVIDCLFSKNIITEKGWIKLQSTKFLEDLERLPFPLPLNISFNLDKKFVVFKNLFGTDANFDDLGNFFTLRPMTVSIESIIMENLARYACTIPSDVLPNYSSTYSTLHPSSDAAIDGPSELEFELMRIIKKSGYVVITSKTQTYEKQFLERLPEPSIFDLYPDRSWQIYLLHFTPPIISEKATDILNVWKFLIKQCHETSFSETADSIWETLIEHQSEDFGVENIKKIFQGLYLCYPSIISQLYNILLF
jgi:hypothetical protein